MMFQLLLDTGINDVAPSGGSSLLLPILVVGAVLLLIVIGIALKTLRRPEMVGMTPERVRQLWAEIQKTSSQGVMGAKLSVIEADKLLDNVLKSLMIPGETLGERLKAGQYKHPNLRHVWTAHKLRNQLVHDSSFEITIGAAKRALKDYEAALKTLHVL